MESIGKEIDRLSEITETYLRFVRLPRPKLEREDPVLHQRLYQLTACSLPLLLLRLPPVKRWAARQHKAGRDKVVYLVFLPLAALYIIFFAYIVNEEIFKGVSAFRLQPVDG